MKKISVFLLLGLLVVGCSKHDPILPGERHDVFENADIYIINRDVPELSQRIKLIYGDEQCDYRQDSENNIWLGEKKIFAGFMTNNSVNGSQSPICSGNYIYTGLSTGEVIKLNAKTKSLIWLTDVYKTSNLTGAATLVDIVARVGLDGEYVYAGGLGDAFCKLRASNGARLWCVNISVPVDFILVDNFAFVVGADNYLYAINTDNGKVYWRTKVKKQVKPDYNGNYITVGRQHINYTNGDLL